MATIEIKDGSPIDLFVKKELDYRIKMGLKSVTNKHKVWGDAEDRVVAYVKESELDGKRRNRRDNGLPVYTTMQIPYSYAMLMSAHTYWTSVFFARSPVHQYTGRHGETEQSTQALEALIDYQVTTGEAVGPYYIWLYDMGKYGLGILGTYWDKEVFRLTTIEPSPGGSLAKQKVVQELVGYEGNRVYNVSPFDFYPDPRVSVGQFQKGEFCFIRRRLAWNDIVRRQTAGYYTNVDALKISRAFDNANQENYSSIDRPDTSTQTADSDSPQHPATVDAYEFYIDLIPSEWKLGDSTYPEKWVITITKDNKTIFGIQPLGLLHNKFPFDVGEIEIEAYGQYNRGIPEIIQPLQNTMDWLVNVHFYNTRAVLNNLFLADPTKIVMKDFENSEAGGIIRLKPEAYGGDINTFFKQIPITDITQSNFQDLAIVQGIGEKTLGISDQIMGSFGAGRKTATEVRTATGFGINRLKTVSEYISATAFSQHSQKLVMNSQQFYTTEKKFKIVGSLMLEAGASFMDVTPDAIAGFYDFVPVDGTLPIDRMAQANLWKEILLNVGRVPQIAQAFDLSRIFAWMAQIAGLKNINQFKIQVLAPGQPPAPGSVPIGLPQLGQPQLPPGASTPGVGTLPPPAPRTMLAPASNPAGTGIVAPA